MINEFNIWFENIYDGTVNINIVLLCLKDIKDIKTNRELYKITENNFNIQIYNFSKLDVKKLNSDIGITNIVAYTNHNFSFVNLNVLKNNMKIILVDEYNTYSDFISHLNNKYYHKSIYPHFIFQKYEPINVISDVLGIGFIGKFIYTLININNNNNKCKIDKHSINVYLLRNIPKVSIKTILGDIEFLKFKSILTSRLAIFIYKICTFDYNASEKKIGLYFSKNYGQSKIVNGKKFGVVNTKGYIINENIAEQQIKLDIAKKLQELQVNNYTILQATGIKLQ